MNRKTVQITIAASFLVSSVILMADNPTNDAAKLKPLKVRILACEKTDLAGTPFLSFSCEASNPNKSTVMFVGYRPDSFSPPIPKGRISPIYELEVLRTEKWEKHPIGWCGTGMDGIELPAGQTQKFNVELPADATAKKVRIGIRWSQPLDFDTAEADAFNLAWSESFEPEKGAGEQKDTAEK